MISPGRKRRRTIEPLLRARNVPELPAKIGSLSSSSGDSRSPCGSRTSSTLLLVSAPVGHETMHSPQPTHVECPMGTSASNAMAAPDPLPIRPMTKFCLTSLQARMHRSHRMQAEWSTLMIGDESSRSEEHTSELQSRFDLVCRLLLE